MKVVQILPELEAGGVERGTLELSEFLVDHGHESIVISNGGQMVSTLESTGSRHIAMPVHRKHPASLLQIPKLRKLLIRERPDILHLRSRLPAWLAWLAWKTLPADSRPKLVTTVHGFYSVNAYSAVMTRGEAVIAVSGSVREYVLKNYPKTDPSKITVIHRGIDETTYRPEFRPSPEWLETWNEQHPELANRKILLMPGRLTRWKGQEDFIHLLSRLTKQGQPVHGLIVGGAHPKKKAYEEELRSLADSEGVAKHISFLGHRNDLLEIMAVSRIVYSLSHDPEAFGRVSLEALALGKPVIAYDHGGVAEQLRAIFPSGLIPPGDLPCAVDLTLKLLKASDERPQPAVDFTLSHMQHSTFGIYQKLTSSDTRSDS